MGSSGGVPLVLGVAGQGTARSFEWFASGTSGTDVANTVYAAQIVVPPGTILPLTGIAVGLGATAVGNAIVAMFDKNGNQVAVSASTVISGTYKAQLIPFTAVYNAVPGVYSIAVIFSGAATSDTVIAVSPSGVQLQGSFAMPATITALTSVSTYIPVMSTY